MPPPDKLIMFTSLISDAAGDDTFAVDVCALTSLWKETTQHCSPLQSYAAHSIMISYQLIEVGEVAKLRASWLSIIQIRSRELSLSAFCDVAGAPHAHAHIDFVS